jgi:hypothetical protein
MIRSTPGVPLGVELARAFQHLPRASGVNRTYIRTGDRSGSRNFALDGVNTLDERQPVAELLARRVGQRSPEQRMRDRVERLADGTRRPCPIATVFRTAPPASPDGPPRFLP